MDSGDNNAASQHTIRLRGPCTLAWLRNGTQQEEVRVQIPCQLDSDLFQMPAITDRDRFVLRRNFGKPSGLEPSQRVTLELSGFKNAQRVILNHKKNQEVAQDFLENSVLISVAEVLQSNNRLEVEFDTLPAFAGDVRLVIEEQAA
jgi:hypothetical protein